jgi:hypothetical protein
VRMCADYRVDRHLSKHVSDMGWYGEVFSPDEWWFSSFRARKNSRALSRGPSSEFQWAYPAERPARDSESDLAIINEWWRAQIFFSAAARVFGDTSAKRLARAAISSFPTLGS